MLKDLEQEVEQWIASYKPVANHLNDSSGWIINEKAIMFETYGDEFEFVKSQPNNNVWTWVDGDEGTLIVAGLAYVNRIGYFVTDVAWTDINTIVEVDYYSEYDEQEEAE